MTDLHAPAGSPPPGEEPAAGQPQPQDDEVPTEPEAVLDAPVQVDEGTPPRTGDAEVDSALTALHEVGQAPLGAHINAATALHERLQHRLSDVHD